MSMAEASHNFGHFGGCFADPATIYAQDVARGRTRAPAPAGTTALTSEWSGVVPSGTQSGTLCCQCGSGGCSGDFAEATQRHRQKQAADHRDREKFRPDHTKPGPTIEERLGEGDEVGRG